MARLEVSGLGPIGPYVVRLDGSEIQKALRGMRLDLHAGQAATAELEVKVETTEVDTEVRAFVPDATRDLLIRLGWTPPAEGTLE